MQPRLLSDIVTCSRSSNPKCPRKTVFPNKTLVRPRTRTTTLVRNESICALHGLTAPRARRGKVMHDNADVHTELFVFFVREWEGWQQRGVGGAQRERVVPANRGTRLGVPPFPIPRGVASHTTCRTRPANAMIVPRNHQNVPSSNVLVISSLTTLHFVMARWILSTLSGSSYFSARAASGGEHLGSRGGGAPSNNTSQLLSDRNSSRFVRRPTCLEEKIPARVCIT